MAKIPVERTISGAYSFAFKNILTVIGIAWLPFVLVFALAAGLVLLMVPGLTAPGGPSPPALAGLIGILPLIVFLYLVAKSMVAVGLMRRALGLSSGPMLAYFSLSAPVWRMLGAMILLMLIFTAMITAEAGIIGAVIGAGASTKNGALDFLGVILVIVAVLWSIYFMVRIGFFLPAVVVAEERIGIGRSWQLGSGNFWRIFVVWLAIVIPVGMGASMLMQAFYGNSLMALMLAQQQGGNPDPAALLHGMMQIFIANGPYLAVIQLIEIIVMSGLVNGAIASAYRSVTGTGDAAPSTSPGPA